MTVYTTTAAVIRQRLVDQWSTTAIIGANTIRDDGPDAPFVQFGLMWGESQLVSIGDPGNRRYRFPGRIQMEVVTDANEGPGLGEQYADSLAAIYRGQEFGGVICREASMMGQMLTSDGKYWLTPVSISFYTDAIL